MSSPQLPDFDHSLQQVQGSLDASELAECHGVLCGFLAVSPQAGADDFLRQLHSLHLMEEPGPVVRTMLTELFQATSAQLSDEEMGFRLWLPDDQEPLEERTEALSRWCTGLLAGLAIQGNPNALSGEVGEALKDLEQIARAGLSAGGEGGEQALEDDEQAFTEITEYVRVVAMMLREDFRGPQQGEPIH
jgi:uncharacterized protein YgfB (UPF0149 family)